MRILNLYSGIGGNRKLWGDDLQITSVEFDPLIAEVYRELYPQDDVVVGDALQYLEDNFEEFDFVWSSPPCPSHGQYRHNVGVLGKGYKPVVPDMTSLYGQITFLKTYFNGSWVVENVVPYYGVLVEPTVCLQRHLFWSNFDIQEKKFSGSGLRTKNKISDFEGSSVVQNSRIKNKRQVLRNCVDPEVGHYVLQCGGVL